MQDDPPAPTVNVRHTQQASLYDLALKTSSHTFQGAQYGLLNNSVLAVVPTRVGAGARTWSYLAMTDLSAIAGLLLYPGARVRYSRVP